MSSLFFEFWVKIFEMIFFLCFFVWFQTKEMCIRKMCNCKNFRGEMLHFFGNKIQGYQHFWQAIYLNRCPAELPCRSARWVVDEQRFAVPKAPTPRVHPAAQRSNGCLCCSDVVLFSIIDGLIPTALVVMMMRVMVAPMTAALTWTHTGHGAQRASQLPPCLAAGGLCPKVWGAAAACCCTNIWEYVGY